MSAMTHDTMMVREWDAEAFHRGVLALEAEGYVAHLDTYQVTPEMNPETGEIIHLHTIELSKSAGAAAPGTPRD
ncbi:MAG TPA: hypothetical protein VKU44_08560 [Terriglobia bacterium]|nr:hypothetical protein [Terriglobia bacterium]